MVACYRVRKDVHGNQTGRTLKHMADPIPNNMPTAADIARTTRTASQLTGNPRNAGEFETASVGTYIDRMTAELSQLGERYAKLGEFLEGDVYKALSEREQELLQMQYDAMNNYGRALAERLQLATGGVTAVEGVAGEALDDDDTPAPEEVLSDENITDPPGGGTPNDDDAPPAPKPAKGKATKDEPIV
jgi:hypothetical protein